MEKIEGPNVTDGKQFAQKLQDIMLSIYNLLEFTKEYNLEPVTEDGCNVYFEESGKTCFQVSGQYDRPHEFLQSLLDVIHVNFEPYAMGAFLLNANMDFLYSEIPETSFTLGYVSITSKKNEDFEEFWNNSVRPYLKICGYDIDSVFVMYAVATTGEKRYGPDFMGEISTTLDSGFSLDEALGLICSSIKTCVSKPRKKTYAGYCLDQSMGSRIRLSLWFFVDRINPIVQ